MTRGPPAAATAFALSGPCAGAHPAFLRAGSQAGALERLPASCCSASALGGKRHKAEAASLCVLNLGLKTRTNQTITKYRDRAGLPV